MKAHNLTFIHFNVCLDEQTAPVLQAVKRIGKCLAFHHGDKYAVIALRQLSLAYRSVVVKNVRHNSTARGKRHEH